VSKGPLTAIEEGYFGHAIEAGVGIIATELRL
jgi:hypothetical protein